MAVALLALFVALSGTGYAAAKINGKNIQNGTILGTALKKNTLGSNQINESKIGKVPDAANSDVSKTSGNSQLFGGLAPSAFVQGSGKTAAKNTEVAASSTATILEIPGLVRIQGTCDGSNALSLTIDAPSAPDAGVRALAQQMGSGSPSVTGQNLTGASSFGFGPDTTRKFTLTAWINGSQRGAEISGATYNCRTSVSANVYN